MCRYVNNIHVPIKMMPLVVILAQATIPLREVVTQICVQVCEKHTHSYQDDAPDGDPCLGNDTAEDVVTQICVQVCK